MHDCSIKPAYAKLKSYWIKKKFLNENKFLNKYKISEKKQTFWMKMKFLNEMFEIDKITQNWMKNKIKEWTNNYWIENILLNKYVNIA